MPTYLHPGVYVEEIPSGSKPIEGVATSVAAFVGKATKGPVGKAKLIQSFDDYNNLYGDIASEEDAMGLAVQAFYLNGGKSAFICRLADEGSTAATESVNGQDTSTAVLNISASSEGDWGNKVYFRIVKPDKDSLTFDLEIGHKKKDEFVVDEEFKGLSMRAGDDNFAPAQVNGNSAYVELSLGDAANPEESAEQYQNATMTSGEFTDSVTNASDYFNSSAFSWPMSLTLNINGLGAELITIDPTQPIGNGTGSNAPIDGSDNAADGRKVTKRVQLAIQDLSMDSANQNFTCSYSSNRFALTSSKSGSLASIEIYDGDLAGLLKLDSKKPAIFNGGPGVASSFFAGGDYFKVSITEDVTLALNIDDHLTGNITLKLKDLELDGVNKTDGEKVALAIQKAVQALDSSIVSYKDFKCKYLFNAGSVAKRMFLLTSGSGSARNSSLTVDGGSLVTILALNSASGATEISGRQLDQGTAKVIPIHSLGPRNGGVKLADGTEVDATANDFTDFYNNTLRKVRDVSIILVPGQHWAKDGSGNSILSATLAHCEAMKSRVVIIDPPPDLELDQSATVHGLSLPSSTYSVLYYPWVKVKNPIYNAETNPTAAKTVDVGPSSFAAGMWSRIDGKRGVWKAPAGMEAGLIGTAGLKYIIEDGEQDQLNPLGVNCFRNIPGGGRVIWGSRTLATKADPEWRYVPVRRTAIMIEQSIYNGIQWAVFEPNDHRLWSALRGNIGGFMNSLFRVGAFQGEKASDAYFVRCGLGDTMTQTDIDAGQVIVIVGFAPLKPAEFVIVRIQQKVNQQ